MGQIFLFALLAALNPTLVAASTIMMVLSNPVKLMLGYLLGAMLTSITLGIVIVETLSGSGAVSTTRSALSPAADLALGSISLAIAFVLHGDRARHRRARRGERRADKGPPRWQQALNKGSPRVTFVIGALLTLPGASYLAGLSRISKHAGTGADAALLVIGFNIVMLALLEVPLIAFVVAPEWTPKAIERAKRWVAYRVHAFIVGGFTVLGTLLILKGVIELIRAS